MSAFLRSSMGIPKPPPVTNMPIPNDPVAMLAQRQTAAALAQRRGGIQSTILSSGSQPYTAPKFGS